MRILRARELRKSSTRVFEFAAVVIIGGAAVLGAWTSVARAGAKQAAAAQNAVGIVAKFRGNAGDFCAIGDSSCGADSGGECVIRFCRRC